MNDLISRRAAIDAGHKNYDTILDFKSDGRTVADSFEDIINALPSAQPSDDYNRGWEDGQNALRMESCDIRGCDNRDAIKVIEKSLCDSCINIGCIFQSGIVRSRCDFYKAERWEE